MSEPKCIEVVVQSSGGGKVAIREFGKISSQWGVSFTRKFEIPEDWTKEQIDEFQINERQHLRDIIDPIDNAEFTERYDQRNWDDD